MIVEGLVTVVVALAKFIAGLFGNLPAPTWLTDVNGQFASFVASLTGVGVWVPWNVMATVVTAVLGCVGIGFAIKVVRLVASYFTAGGGSAG